MTTLTRDGEARPRNKNPRPTPKPSSQATRNRPAGGRIDPRMRARRVAVRRDEGRRRLRRVAVFAAAASVVALGYLATRSPLLDVDHVRVHGAVHTDDGAIVAASGISTGDPMTDVALGRAGDSIATLPRVESVRVQRRWPGTIDIHVTERAPAAAVLTESGDWLVVDGTSRVLESVPAAPDGLPIVASASAAAEPGEVVPGIGGALAVVSALTPDLRAWVALVEPADDGTVEIALHHDIRVRLGTEAHLSAKVVDLATVLTRVDLTDLRTIDLTVPHTSVLTRSP